MTVKELVGWLTAFEDQDAEVKVIKHVCGSSYYDQGGTVEVVSLEPDVMNYTDLRSNPFIKEDCLCHGSHTLLLGELNA
jgi:hypothetical protein